MGLPGGRGAARTSSAFAARAALRAASMRSSVQKTVDGSALTEPNGHMGCATAHAAARRADKAISARESTCSARARAHVSIAIAHRTH